MKTLQTRELELLKKWRENNDQMALNELMNSFAPIIRKQINVLRGYAPETSDAILDGIVKKSVLKSFKNYDFNRGVQLSTYVISNFPETYRDIYPLQNIARIPDHRVTKVLTYKSVFDDLSEKLGRPPNLTELQDELLWDKKEIQRMQKEVRKDIGEALGDIEPIIPIAQVPEAYNIVYDSLTKQEKDMADYLMGAHGKPRLGTYVEVAKKLNVDPKTVRNFKDALVRKIKRF